MTEKIYAETGIVEMPKGCGVCSKCEGFWFCQAAYKRISEKAFYMSKENIAKRKQEKPLWCPLRKGILAIVIDENTVIIDGRVFKEIK
ncbi:MAG: hypothetical protein EOM59_11655 [Clostridia bacterium]|nr:hypothetical protein [Clostridia bacterium]